MLQFRRSGGSLTGPRCCFLSRALGVLLLGFNAVFLCVDLWRWAELAGYDVKGL